MIGCFEIYPDASWSSDDLATWRPRFERTVGLGHERHHLPMRVWDRFPPTAAPSPLTIAEIDAIERHYDVEYPSDVRDLLLTYGPGSFDREVSICIPQNVPGVRHFHPFDGFYILEQDQPEVTGLRDRWSSYGYDVKMPNATGALFPWGAISEVTCCWRLAVGSTDPLLALHPVHPEAAHWYEMTLEGLLQRMLIDHESTPDGWLRTGTHTEHFYRVP